MGSSPIASTLDQGKHPWRPHRRKRQVSNGSATATVFFPSVRTLSQRVRTLRVMAESSQHSTEITSDSEVRRRLRARARSAGRVRAWHSIDHLAEITRASRWLDRLRQSEGLALARRGPRARLRARSVAWLAGGAVENTMSLCLIFDVDDDVAPPPIDPLALSPLAANAPPALPHPPSVSVGRSC